MKIIKRNGAEVVFDIEKIRNAITKANQAVEEAVRMTPLQIKRIAEMYKMEEAQVRSMVPVEEVKKDLASNKALDLVRSSAVISTKKEKKTTKKSKKAAAAETAEPAAEAEAENPEA